MGEFDIHGPGLKRPKTVEEGMAIQADVHAMRRAITFAQRDSSLINRCLSVAESEGLSSEETMVLLAYNALCMLEDSFGRELKMSMLDIHAPLRNQGY